MTTASTAGGAVSSQRKASAHTELSDEEEKTVDPEEVDEVDEDSEEEYKEGGSQKYISPIEVRDHIERLWNKEHELLGLIYGRFDRTQPFKTDSMGFKQFF